MLPLQLAEEKKSCFCRSPVVCCYLLNTFWKSRSLSMDCQGLETKNKGFTEKLYLSKEGKLRLALETQCTFLLVYHYKYQLLIMPLNSIDLWVV